VKVFRIPAGGCRSGGLAAMFLVVQVHAACPQPTDQKSFEAAFEAASVQRFSLDRLACAADMSAQRARQSPKDVDLQMLALDAQIDLLLALQQQLDTQTYQGGDAYVDIKKKWALGIAQGKAISARLATPAAQTPSLAGLRIAFDLASVSSVLAPPEQAFKVAVESITQLEKLLTRDPKLLDGIGEMMLGRLYYQLPESAGGEVEKAVVHLRNAHAIAPDNIEIDRWLAESLVATGGRAQALEVLRSMLPLDPEPVQRQQFADELRAASGLATRSGDDELSRDLAAKRDRLLHQYPELQTRQTAAISGHGGVDPLTGRSND